MQLAKTEIKEGVGNLSKALGMIGVTYLLNKSLETWIAARSVFGIARTSIETGGSRHMRLSVHAKSDAEEREQRE